MNLIMPPAVNLTSWFYWLGVLICGFFWLPLIWHIHFYWLEWWRKVVFITFYSLLRHNQWI